MCFNCLWNYIYEINDFWLSHKKTQNYIQKAVKSKNNLVWKKKHFYSKF